MIGYWVDIARNFFRKFVFAVTITISIQIFRVNIEQKGIGVLTQNGYLEKVIFYL